MIRLLLNLLFLFIIVFPATATNFTGALVNSNSSLIRSVEYMIEKGKLREGLERLREVIANPDRYTREEVAYAYLRLGIEKKYGGDPDGALSMYEKAYSLGKGTEIELDALSSMSAIYMMKGDLDTAMELLKEVLERSEDPSRARYASLWLKYLERLKRYEAKYGPVSYACGKNVLTLLAEKVGLGISLNEILSLVNDEEGLRITELRDLLVKNGVRAKVVRAPLKKVASSGKPAIIHTRDNHYLLLLGLRGQHADYIDPAIGRRIITSSLSILEKRYSGYALVIDENNLFKALKDSEIKDIKGAHCICCPAPPPLGSPQDRPITGTSGPTGGGGGPGGDCPRQGLPFIRVDTIMMALFLSDLDFRYRHYGIDVKLERYYHSDYPYSSIFGFGWIWNYGSRLRILSDTEVDLLTPGGRIVRYSLPQGATEFTGPGDYLDRLWKEGNSYVLYRKREGNYWIFDSEGKLIRIEDRNGNYIRFEYVDSTIPYKPLFIEDSAGRRIYFKYNSLGLVTRIETFDGSVMIFEYDDQGRLVKTVDAFGTEVTYTYDDNSYLTSITYPSGTYMIKYGPRPFYANRPMVVTEIVLPNGTSTKYFYEPSGWVRVDYSDGSSRWYLDSVLWKTTDIRLSKGNRLWIRYNAMGLPSGFAKDPNRWIDVQYDSRKNVTKITYPDGSYEEFTYNDLDLVTTYRDRRGNLWTFEYDSKGNLLRIVDPLGNTSTIEYDQKGLPVRLTDQEGNETAISYDRFGYPRELTLPSGKKWTFEFNALGDLVAIRDPEGNITTVEYDELRRMTEIRDPLGNSLRFLYNHLYMTALIDQEGKRTDYIYNSLDLLTRVCRDATCYEFIRNPTGRVIGLLDYNRNVWMFLRDRDGDLVGIEDPLGNVTNYEVDRTGRILAKVLPGGERIEYSYTDDLMVKKTYPDGTEVEYTYDSAGNLINARDPSASFVIEYDALSRPVMIEDTRKGLVARYSYHPTGRLKGINYLGDLEVTYSYDPDGNLTEIKIGDLGKVSFDYTPSGRIKTLKLGKVRLDYAYDRAGNLLSIKAKANREFRLRYKRDKMGRLIGFEAEGLYPVSQIIEPPEITEAFYDTASQLKEFKSNGQKNDLVYDERGNLTEWITDGTRTQFIYDYENRLTEVRDESGELIARYRYSPLGYRREKETSDRHHYYLYGAEGNLLYEVIEENHRRVEERFYIYLPGLLDRPIAMVIKRGTTKEVYYYIHNHLGSVIALVGGEGRIVNVYDYWADGNLRYIEEKVPQPFRYTGAYHDEEVNLYYLRARHYSPVLRRFLQRDPILFDGGINLYSYTGCDFVNRGDWEGLWSVDIQVGVGLSAIVRIGYARGRPFIEFKGGFGFGGGIAFDPWGEPTFRNPKSPMCREFAVGFGYEVQASIGPVIPTGAAHYGYIRYCEPGCSDSGYTTPIRKPDEPAFQPKFKFKLGLGLIISLVGGHIVF